MNRGITEKSLLSVNHQVNNLAMSANPDRVRHDVVTRMREHAASLIAKSDKVEEQRGDYSTAFRLTVYVLNPDDLHRMVTEEAQKLCMMRPVKCVPDPDVNVALLEALELVNDCLVKCLTGGEVSAKLAGKAIEQASTIIEQAKAVKP